MDEFVYGIRKRAFVSIAGISILLTGCGGSSAPKPSGAYPTNSIYAFMKAAQEENGNITTTVQLRDGPDVNTAGYLYLSSGEVLYSSLNRPPQQYMSFSNNLFSNSLDLSQRVRIMSSRYLYMDYVLFSNVVSGKPEYFASDSPDAGTTTARAYVDFERSGQVMAGTSYVDIPTSFQITEPATAARIPRATPITLTWAGADPSTTMRLGGAIVCEDTTQNSWNSISIPNTGTATLNSADFLPAASDPTKTCQTIFMLQSVKTVLLSTPFALGSNFEGIQQRTVQFSIVP